MSLGHVLQQRDRIRSGGRARNASGGPSAYIRNSGIDLRQLSGLLRREDRIDLAVLFQLQIRITEGAVELFQGLAAIKRASARSGAGVAFDAALSDRLLLEVIERGPLEVLPRLKPSGLRLDIAPGGDRLLDVANVIG